MTDAFITSEGALHYLTDVGQKDDDQIDIIESALAFSALDTASHDITIYRKHINEVSKQLSVVFDNLAALENGDGVNVQAQALKQVLAVDQGYIGDDQHYDDLSNINLFSVIDRRLGLPISLCILGIGLCRRQGWNADGVNFPGHFIMRLEKDGERLMVDPFQGCAIQEAKDLRQMLKRIVGKEAELSADYYVACTNREILLRYQNNMKYRLIDHGKYEDALEIVKRMELIAPQDFRLALDKAVLYARLEQARAAIDELLIYLDQVSDPYDKAEAEAFLFELQKQLN